MFHLRRLVEPRNPSRSTAVKKPGQFTLLHLKADEGQFILLCGKRTSEVSYWTYLNLYDANFGAKPAQEICPECGEWINLQVLAEAEL